MTDLRDPAVICRERGWGPGTRLVGDEGYGPTVIEITAVGEAEILARGITHKGKPVNWRESSWVLWCRDWTELSAGSAAGGPGTPTGGGHPHDNEQDQAAPPT